MTLWFTWKRPAMILPRSYGRLVAIFTGCRCKLYSFLIMTAINWLCIKHKIQYRSSKKTKPWYFKKTTHFSPPYSVPVMKGNVVSTQKPHYRRWEWFKVVRQLKFPHLPRQQDICLLSKHHDFLLLVRFLSKSIYWNMTENKSKGNKNNYIQFVTKMELQQKVGGSQTHNLLHPGRYSLYLPIRGGWLKKQRPIQRRMIFFFKGTIFWVAKLAFSRYKKGEAPLEWGTFSGWRYRKG